MNYISHTAQLDEDPHKLAEKAIRLLETRIYEEFGLKLRMGAEIEFSLIPKDPKKVAVGWPVPADAKKNDFTPAMLRKKSRHYHYIDTHDETIEATDPLVPDSPNLSHSYHESERNKYEIVLSHEAEHDTMPPDGSRAMGFVGAIEDEIFHIKTAGSKGKNLAKDKTHNRMLKDVFQQWSPSFSGYEDDPSRVDVARTHGLHINVSLVDKNNAPPPENIFHEVKISEYFQRILEEGMYLSITDDSSYQRFLARQGLGLFRSRAEPAQMFEIQRFAANSSPVFEIQMFAANSSPDYAMLTVLAGIYDALITTGQHNKNAPEILNLNRFSYINNRFLKLHSFDELKGLFLHGENTSGGKGQMIALLNTLEAGLGDRFAGAIEKHPPFQQAEPQTGVTR